MSRDITARGRSGIRTHEGLAPLTVFKTVAFVRSAILPSSSLSGLAHELPFKRSELPRGHP